MSTTGQSSIATLLNHYSLSGIYSTSLFLLRWIRSLRWSPVSSVKAVCTTFSLFPWLLSPHRFDHWRLEDLRLRPLLSLAALSSLSPCVLSPSLPPHWGREVSGEFGATQVSSTGGNYRTACSSQCDQKTDLMEETRQYIYTSTLPPHVWLPQA
jgi:hypothetical protein